MKRLIINADDLGYDPAVTRGILQAMRTGVVTSATLMVNTPFSEAAAEQARGLAIGLHLNLARHPPVSKAIPPSLLSGGAFDEQRAGALPAEAVEQETLAQLERLEALLGAPATHVDVHKHLHIHANVLDGLCAAARARDLPVRSITTTMREALKARGVRTNDHFVGDAGATAYWTFDRLAAHAGELEDGITEWMCHPGYAPTETKSGYSVQREVELATFVDPRARELLACAGAELVDFRALC
ncbi:MAG: ChbG/HpnK family deacetylase [Myxococcaceae bacterium]|nr:ChbG/HpnK family deacetylase [Myxococcaceae bacterium]